jgi:long-chain acyl-CoA synthetase
MIFSPKALYEQALKRGKAEFIVRPDRALPYDQFIRGVNGSCALFDKKGADIGDRVLIITRDEDAAITLFVAALLDGLVPVMLSPDTPESRARSLAAKVAPKLIFMDPQLTSAQGVASVVSIDPPHKDFLGRLRRPKTGFWASVQEASRSPRLPDNRDLLAYILFTSGTTTEPKCVTISHRALFAHLKTLSRLYGYEPDSRIFNGLVWAHADGLLQGPLLAFANGCVLIRPTTFSTHNLEAWLNSIRALRATHVISVPAVYSMIERYATHDDYFDAPECRYLISAAAKLETPLWERMNKRFKHTLYNQYGLTETVTAGIYAGPHLEMGLVGTIGKPVDMQVRLVGLDGRDVTAGEMGEIWLSGENVFSGYWGEPRFTAEVLTDDGWLRTGDMATLEVDGSYAIRGRLKTVILCGGYLIRPDEIDEVLKAHPAVIEVATIGMPDADFGEIPVSAVVLRKEASEAELTDYCREHLEGAKVPKRIIRLDELPRGDAGKVKIEVLRQKFDPIVGPKTGSTSATSSDGIGELSDLLLDLASVTFRVPRETLSLETHAKDVSGWDSFAHINLILHVERRLGLRIPTADVAGIETLADLKRSVERAR